MLIYTRRKTNIHIEVFSSSRVSINLPYLYFLTRSVKLDLTVTSHHLNAVNGFRHSHDVTFFF